MKKIIFLHFLTVILLFINSKAICCSIDENHSKGFEFIRQILINEGIKDSLQIQSYHSEYDKLIDMVLKNIDREDNVFDQNEDLFRLLHKTFLEKYILNVRFREIFDHKYYNCVTASALYYAICLDLGFNAKLYSSPLHVYLKVFQGNESIRIELTDPVEGFDFKEKIKDRLVKYLLEVKLVTQEEVNRRGIDSLYNEFYGETREISPLNLNQLLRSNAALDLFIKGKNWEAFKEIRNTLRMDEKNTDKNVQDSYVYIWRQNELQYSKEGNYEKMDSLISDALFYTNIPSDYKKDFLSIAAEFMINCIYDRRPVADIDSLYGKCNSAMQNESFYKEIMVPVKNSLEIYRVQELMNKGYIDDAFRYVGVLYKSSKKQDSKIKDIYLSVSKDYVNYLANNREYEKAIARADTLLQEFPDYPATQDLYTNTVVFSTMAGGLYYKDPIGTEKLLTRAAQIAPKNPRTAKAMTTLYHEYAMDRVRKNDYANALKMVEEGLKFDSSDTLLLSDRELIKPKIENKKKHSSK